MYYAVVIKKDDDGKVINVNLVEYKTVQDAELAVKNLIKYGKITVLDNNNLEVWLYDSLDGNSEVLMRVFNKSGSLFSNIGNSTFIFNKRFSNISLENMS